MLKFLFHFSDHKIHTAIKDMKMFEKLEKYGNALHLLGATYSKQHVHK